MATVKWASVVVIPWLVIPGVVACGREGSNEGNPAATVARPVPSDSAAPSAGFGALAPRDASVSDGGSRRAVRATLSTSRDLAAADAGDAGAPVPAVPTCTPEGGTDVPDDAFVDSNCDGIDGDESAAIFVAPSGRDSASGAKASPVRTLGRGIALAQAAGKSVYACDGVYAENLIIRNVAVSLYGGYACEKGWVRHSERSLVKPTAGAPLRVEAVPGRVVVDRLSLEAPSATSPGDSSIAVVLVGAKDVHLLRDEIIAGEGADGAPGERLPAPAWVTPPRAEDGRDVTFAVDCRLDSNHRARISNPKECGLIFMGGAELSRPCPYGGRVQGGIGGFGGNLALGVGAGIGSTGTPAGTPGLEGEQGASGAAWPGHFGAVAGGKYLPTNAGGDGSVGRPGHAGQGGTGGSSFYVSDALGAPFLVGAGGGQGGFPGCGGAAGKGGGGGGASIGILAEDSGLTLAWDEVFTGRGGDGGPGSGGTSGQSGGHGGRGGNGVNHAAYGTGGIDDGAEGSPGGDGGAGGDGGPGGGGPSVGVVFGAPVAIEHVDFYLGRPGRGARTAASVAPDGVGTEMYGAPARAVP